MTINKSEITKTTVSKSNIEDILSIMDKEKKSILSSTNWNKYPKSKKKKLLNLFIKKETINRGLSNIQESNLRDLILNELNKNNLNRNSNIVFNKDNEIEEIKNLNFNKDTYKYSFKKTVISKNITKSKSNIERILKKI